MLSPSERQVLIGQLARFPAQLAALVGPLTEAQLSTHYLAGEWSVAQIVHHVPDSHMNAYIRCKLILTEDQPTLKPYDQDGWAALPDGCSAAIAPSLALLEALHMRWVSFWEQLPEAAWVRTGLHPDNGVVSLEELLKLYVAHGLAHIEQIGRILTRGEL